MGRRVKRKNPKKTSYPNKKREATFSVFPSEDHTYCSRIPLQHRIQGIKGRISESDEESVGEDQEDTKSSIVVIADDNNSSEAPSPVDCAGDSPQREQCPSIAEGKNNSKMAKILKMEDDKGVLWHIHKCKLCSYRSKSIFVMFKHVGVHRKRPDIDDFICDTKTPEMFQCEPCGFETNLKVDLTEHVRVFHDGKEGNSELETILKCYRCDKCHFETHSLLVLTRHTSNCNTMRTKKVRFKASHVVSKSTDFRCAQCPFRSKRKGNLKIHTIRKHIKPEDLNWFKCGQCDYKSKVKYGLKIHTEINHAPPEDVMSFQCDQCSYKTERNRNLRRHIERMHENPLGIQWFKCRHCPYKTNIEEYLRLHVVRMHNGRNLCLFQCGHCPYKTNVEEYLKQHVVRLHDETDWIKSE